ncbi:GGDEF domain-containing protein [Geotalea uraniireducens]|uniref:diguanylate cyclase n=1 Tax=Geotalea uraniireducens (strain Rf4) TaxID=351605 RepID=A5GBU3_GEOUR|nr:GGDEF domain-containing protein [Geotalea uraniireducens]ABQ24946.1 diguanylate cyclase [Geotalea uraniireducens Rf4]
MKVTVLKKLTIFALPAMLLVAAYLSLPHIAALSPAQRELALFSPYLVVVVGMSLSFAFGRGRVFFILLLQGIFYWSFRTYLQNGINGFAPQVVFQSLCLLLPLNITLFSFIRERGVMTVSGRMRFIFLALQAAMVAWIIRYQHDYSDLPLFLSAKFLHFPFISDLTLPQPALLLIVAGILLIFIRAFTRQSPIDSGLLGSLVAVAVACNWLASTDVPLVFISAAALILSVSVLQDSHNMAYRDDLTGLPSRRALNEQMLGVGRQYVIAMLDVDHFKSFNDSYGHDVGDQVLKMVAKKMAAVKGGGKAYRYGGEEFTILMPRKKMAEAIPFLEEVRKNIATYQLVLRGNDRPKEAKEGKKLRASERGDKSVSVTISIGVAESSDSLRSAEEVLKAADKALYRAKSKGRNQLSK